MNLSLKSVFILVLVAAVISLGLRFYKNSQPLAFTPYSSDLRDDALENGQCVLVTLYANWDLNSSDPIRWLSHDVTIRARARNMLPLCADWTHHAPQVTALMDELNIKSVPAIAIYDPRYPSTPKVIEGLATDRATLDAIASCCD
ncbi:MAG: hypothetical protein ACK5E3_19360 [Planctomycetota bacterium]|jgi:thiol:disulfide interchange protein